MAKSGFAKVMAVLFALLILVGCCKEDAAEKESEKREREICAQLEGTWEIVQEPGKLYAVGFSITFKKDGRVTTKVSGYEASGDYEIKDEEIEVTYFGPGGVTSECYSYSYDGDSFSLWRYSVKYRKVK